MSTTRKFSEEKLNFEKDYTDWGRVLSEGQDTVDHKSYVDTENPVLQESKFARQEENLKTR